MSATTAVRAVRRVPRPRPAGGRRALTAAMLLPSAALLFLFTVLPLLRGLELSVYRWDGAAPTMQRAWLGNYVDLWTDPAFYLALGRTVIWWALHVVLAAGGGLVVAGLIAEVRLRWAQTACRAIAFLPHVLSLAVVGVIWNQLYHPTVGLVNTALGGVGLESLTRSWLGVPVLALPAVGIASAWQAYGFYLVVFLAGMQAIDPQLYEAAVLDGASRWQRFRFVTIPALRNTINLVLLLAFINALKGFGTVWAMTEGGPERSTELAAVYVWKQAFQSGNVGVATAGGFSIAAVALLLMYAFGRWRRRREGEG